MKKIILSSIAAVALLCATSCSDFLDRSPQDSLSPSTFWQSESDAYLALTGVYNGLNNIYHDGHWTENNCVMMDALSDNMFDYFSWEGYSVMTTGNITSTNNGVAGSFFSFNDIRTCNEYLEKTANLAFDNKKQYEAEVRTVRALLYMYRADWFGDFPLLEKTMTLEEASNVERAPRADVRAFVKSELAAVADDLPDRSSVVEGRICKQFAQGLLMREYLWENDFANAEKWAYEIIKNNGGLTLAKDYRAMFEIANQYDEETIFDFSFISGSSRETYGSPMVANGGLGGWSSVVPTVDLMDEYECTDGKTISESPLYNAEYPFLNRDPRLRATLVYPGQVYTNYVDSKDGCYNPMPATINGAKNNDYWENAGNASKSGLQVGKYFNAENVTSETLDHMTMHFKVMRLAEVYLTYAEALIEQNKEFATARYYINLVRERVNMPDIPESVNDQASLRAILHRERRVELANEGLRREDMIRWRVDNNGNWISPTSTDGKPYMVWKMQNVYGIEHLDGEIENRKDANGDWVAHVTGRTGKGTSKTAFDISNYRSFTEKNILWPISQSTIDVNPNLKQTTGY